MRFSILVRRLLMLALLIPAMALASEKVDITITTDAGPIETAQMRGQVVYIDFWASWCAPCRKSFPWMNEMHAKYAEQGLKIIAINVDKEAYLAADFLADLPPEFTIGYDPKAELAEFFELPAMPSAYIINREGEVIDAHYGFQRAKTEEYEASIISALEQGK